MTRCAGDVSWQGIGKMARTMRGKGAELGGMRGSEIGRERDACGLTRLGEKGEYPTEGVRSGWYGGGGGKWGKGVDDNWH